MQSCELAISISTLACCIAEGKSPEEIALISSIFMQLGDTLTTIAAHQALCAPPETEKKGELNSAGNKKSQHTFADDTKTTNTQGGSIMAKAGMRRPSPYDADNHGTENHQTMHHPKNEQAQVPEIQGAAKNGNAKAGPINAPNWARDDYKTGEH